MGTNTNNGNPTCKLAPICPDHFIIYPQPKSESNWSREDDQQPGHQRGDLLLLQCCLFCQQTWCRSLYPTSGGFPGQTSISSNNVLPHLSLSISTNPTVIQAIKPLCACGLIFPQRLYLVAHTKFHHFQESSTKLTHMAPADINRLIDLGKGPRYEYLSHTITEDQSLLPYGYRRQKSLPS
jgi:hypothetical protein